MHFFDLVRTYDIKKSHLKALKDLFDKTSDWEQHTFVTHDDKYISPNGENELDICFDSPFELSCDIGRDLIGRYFEEFPQSRSPAFSRIRLNRYTENALMDRHWDNIKTLFTGENRGTPILSLVGLVNQPEEGGEFVMTIPDGDSSKFLVNEGEAVVFPSTFIYSHEVLPVKKGVRDSFVAWTYN